MCFSLPVKPGLETTTKNSREICESRNGSGGRCFRDSNRSCNWCTLHCLCSTMESCVLIKQHSPCEQEKTNGKNAFPFFFPFFFGSWKGNRGLMGSLEFCGSVTLMKVEVFKLQRQACKFSMYIYMQFTICI